MTTHAQITDDVQVDMFFSGPAHMQLCSLMKRTVALSRANVVRSAMHLFDHLRTETLKGAKVHLGQEDAESWSEIDILSIPPFGKNNADNDEPYHLGLTLSNEANARLEETRAEMGYENLTEVIRHALAVYDHIVARVQEGDKLYLVRSEEEKDSVGIPGVA